MTKVEVRFSRRLQADFAAVDCTDERFAKAIDRMTDDILKMHESGERSDNLTVSLNAEMWDGRKVPVVAFYCSEFQKLFFGAPGDISLPPEMRAGLQ